MADLASSIICIIDHDCRTRNILREQLEKAGFAIMEARDADEGNEILRHTGARLAIVDVITASVSELKAKFPMIRILAISGSHQRYLEVARELGADDILAKPFVDGELLDRVRYLLRK